MFFTLRLHHSKTGDVSYIFGEIVHKNLDIVQDLVCEKWQNKFSDEIYIYDFKLLDFDKLYCVAYYDFLPELY